MSALPARYSSIGVDGFPKEVKLLPISLTGIVMFLWLFIE